MPTQAINSKAYKRLEHYKAVIDYAAGIRDGTIIANRDRILTAERFFADLKNPAYELNYYTAELCIDIIEKTFRHIKGPLTGQPFLLEPWEKFICYNLAGFYLAGTEERRFKEAFIFIPRKNGKTPFASALAFALATLEYRYNATLYFLAQSLKRALEAFEIIRLNIAMADPEKYKVLNNNQEHSVSRQFYDAEGNLSGMMKIEALAAATDKADGLNAPFFVLDEIHAYKNATQYYVYKQGSKAYINKLLCGITTAGTSMNSFCYKHLLYCQKVLAKTVRDEQLFIFICMADNPDDYTNPVEHEKANPNYGVTIRPQDILEESLQAQNHPDSRNDFLNKSLNIYTNALQTYFNPALVIDSDAQYTYTLEELVKLNLTWYGGADLSKMHDLTGAALVAMHGDTLIVLSHGFIPVKTARKKAQEDNVPFGWWQEEDWLTLCNSETIEYTDVVKWFIDMRKLGLKIRVTGYDRRYSRKFVMEMKKAGFTVKDQSQRYVEKTEAFREIENRIINQKFAYLHNKAYEYCIQNVVAVEDTDEFVRYQKVMPTMRIDLFDASVIAVKQLLNAQSKSENAKGYFD